MPPDQNLAKEFAELATFEVWATAESGWMWYRLFVNTPDAPTKPSQLIGPSGRVVYWSLLTSFIIGVSRMLSHGKRELTFEKILNLMPNTPTEARIVFQANKHEYIKKDPNPRKYYELREEEIRAIVDAWSQRLIRARTRLASLRRSSRTLRECRDKLLAHLDVSHAIDESKAPSLNTERIRRINIAFSHLGNDIISFASNTSIDIGSRVGYQQADDLIRRCQTHEDMHNLQQWALHNHDDAEIARIVHWYRACGLPPEVQNPCQISPRVDREMPSHRRRD